MQRVPFGMRFGLHPSPSLPHTHRQKSSLISAGMSQHLPQLTPAGYPAVCIDFDQQQASMGSVGERHAEGRSVDNGPYPSRHSVEQQHMAGILSQHQYHGQAQAQAHCRAQPANEVMSPSWRLVYGHSPTYTTPSTIRGTSAIMPAQSPMCASVTTPTVHPPWTSGGSHQDQGHYCHNPEPVVYPQPALMQAYQPYTPPLATPAQSILSLVSETSSHVPQYTAQAYLNAPNGTPNPGAAPSSPDINISSASASGEPTPPSQQTRPNCSDRTSGGQTPKLSQRPVHTAACKTRPVGYEGDLGLLQQRCRRQGADEEVISFMDKIFASGVSLEALIRPLTDSEVETAEFGVRTGKVYTGFLALTNEAQGVAPRYVCRLCHASQTWKHSKDVLRHLRRDHFGLADTCKKCYDKFYTKGEMTRHPCKSIEHVRLTGSVEELFRPSMNF